MSAQCNATVNVWPGLFVGSCVHIELLGVRKEDGTYVTGDAVMCVITDPNGNVVATLSLAYMGTRVTLGFASFADGNYRALLPGNAALVAGTTYTFTFSCANPDFRLSHFQAAVVRNA